MLEVKEYIARRLNDIREAEQFMDRNNEYLEGRKDAYNGLLDYIKALERDDTRSTKETK